MTINPNRPKALQSYLLNNTSVSRVWFLKVEEWAWPCIVFNEWDWSPQDSANLGYDKWIDIFPVLIDVVVDYEDFKTWYTTRDTIRKLIWKFNGSLTADWEWTIAFKNFLSPEYHKEDNKIIFGWIYLFKQNYDYNTD